MLPWSLVAAAIAVVVVSTATSPTCTVTRPCSHDWLFSAVLPFLLSSVVLLWWQPTLAHASAALYSAVAILADPSAAGRMAALGYGVVSVGLVLVRARLRWYRGEELRAVAVTGRVPTWVVDRLTAEGVQRWSLPHVAGAAGAVAVGLLSVGLLSGAWTEYQDRLTRSSESTGVVISRDAEDPFLVTLEVTDDAGRSRLITLMTLEEYAANARVEVRQDPADAQWVELVSEPWDETYWLSLALAGLGAAALLGLEARRRRRDLVALTSAVQPTLRVCAAPLQGSDAIGLAHVEDPTRRVWGVLTAPVAVSTLDPVAVDDAARWESPAEDPDEGEELRWERPTIGTLYGDLREGGTCALVLDSLGLVTHRLREPRSGERVLPDPRPGLPLPTDLETGEPSDDALALLRMEALGDAEPVPPAVTPPVLPHRSHAGSWRRLWAAVQVAVCLAAVPALVLLDEAGALNVALVSAGSAFGLVEGLRRLRPLVLDHPGIWHPQVLRSWLIPWSSVRQALVRNNTVVLEIDPAAAPLGADHASDDVMIFEPPPLASADAARDLASAIEALRRVPVPWDQAGRRGSVSMPVAVLLASHLAIGLVALGLALGR
jgi:hypothetical protein